MKIKKPPVAVRVLLGVVSVLLCIALFCTTVLTLVVTDLRVLTSKNALQSVITQLFFAAPKKNGPVYMFQAVGTGGVRLDDVQLPEGWTLPTDWEPGEELPEGWTLPDGWTLPTESTDESEEPDISVPSDSNAGASQFVVDYLYDFLEEQVGDALPVTKQEVQKILNDSSVPDFVADKMSSMVADILSGESTTTITKEEVMDLVVENKELVEKVIGQPLGEKELEVIAEKVEEIDIVTTVKDTVEVQLGLKSDAPVVDEETGEVTGSQGTVSGKPIIKNNVLQGLLSGEHTVQDVVNGGVPTWLATLREVTSTSVLLTMLGVCMALIVLLFAANYWKLHAALRGVGISLMLAALPFALVNAAIMAVPALFTDSVMMVVATVIGSVAGVSFGTFFGGLAMLIGSIVWGSLRAKKLRSAAQPEQPEESLAFESAESEE